MNSVSYPHRVPPSRPPRDRSPLALVKARYAVECLAGHPLRADEVGTELLDTLADVLVQHRLAPGAELCRPDQRMPGVWILQAGTAQLIVGEGRDQIVVQAICRGESFGVAKLVSDRRGPYRLLAKEPVIALLLPAGPFTLLCQDPGFSALVVSGLSHSLVKAWDRHASATAGSLLVRAARMMLVEERGGTVPLTQAALAAQIGASRPALNRVLRELQRSDLIALEYRRIRILDRAGLVGAAHLDDAAPTAGPGGQR